MRLFRCFLCSAYVLIRTHYNIISLLSSLFGECTRVPALEATAGPTFRRSASFEFGYAVFSNSSCKGPARTCSTASYNGPMEHVWQYEILKYASFDDPQRIQASLSQSILCQSF